MPVALSHRLLSFSIDLNGVLPFLVSAEIIFLIAFCKKKGIWFKGANIILAGMIIFIVGSILNMTTAFGFFIVPAGPDGAFSVHPVIWIIQCIIFVPAWILIGAGLFVLFNYLNKRKKQGVTSGCNRPR
jgi:hypothetical protein